jgi:hypothetical protein
LSRVVEVVRTYLELRSLEQLKPTVTADAAIQFVYREHIAPDHYRRLYRAVGDQWHWHDRNAWSDDQLAAHLSSPNVSSGNALPPDTPPDSSSWFDATTTAWRSPISV